jgi:hypothetical protein
VDNSGEIMRHIDALNDIIGKHNNKSSNLKEEQALLKSELRLNEINKFIDEI